MDEKILYGLKDLGYEGPLLNKGNLRTSIDYGSKNIEYTKVVHYLTKQLRTLCNIDEEVNPITGPEDSNAFVMELSSFLKELNCPYKSLTQGHVSDRLQNLEDRQLLLDYLITELMTARIAQEKMPTKKMELKLIETPEAADLQKIIAALGFGKPPAGITVPAVFQKLMPAVQDLVKRAGGDLVGKAFFNGFLSEKQWETLGDIQNDLHKEYKIRREMLLTRLDVTIQSFQWSDRTKGKNDYFEKLYREKRKELLVDPNVDISHLLAARTDVAIIEKTSSSSVRKNTTTSVHKVIIGQVPDRGGRTNELAPPPPEMPSWQQRIPGPQGGGRGGFNRGGGNFSRGGQSNYGRGNNSFGNYSTSTYMGLKSPIGSLNSDKKPFANFDTSLSSYKSSSLGSSSFRSGYSRDSAGDRSSGYSSNRDSYSRPFDSAGSYDSPNKRPRSSYESTNKDSYKSSSQSQKRYFDIADNDERGNNSSGGDYRSNHAYDSAGSYDVNKRAKSYDNFKTNQSTYSDQYVQDSQSNQQYNSRNEYGRGRSNYHRGRGRGNNYR
ncbi:hypothetical protein HHI36_020964 [Cryptolaemus montrouzieri]|uniref:Protein FAM98A n=1 Tax=Cryptolaemus montrouzieri TaxID=559131 RepID=A0ABD2NCB2_9CUCU